MHMQELTPKYNELYRHIYKHIYTRTQFFLIGDKELPKLKPLKLILIENKRQRINYETKIDPSNNQI